MPIVFRTHVFIGKVAASAAGCKDGSSTFQRSFKNNDGAGMSCILQCLRRADGSRKAGSSSAHYNNVGNGRYLNGGSLCEKRTVLLGT